MPRYLTPAGFCLVWVSLHLTGASVLGQFPAAGNSFPQSPYGSPSGLPAAAYPRNLQNRPQPGPAADQYIGQRPDPSRQQPPGFDQNPRQAMANPQQLPKANLFSPAETMARVGDQYIFRGELEGDVNIILAPILAKLPPDQVKMNRAQIEGDREKLVQQLLTGAVDRKLYYLDFLRSIPVAKREEAEANIQVRTAEAFETGLFKMLERVETAPESEHQRFSRQNPYLFRLALFMKEMNITSLPQLSEALKQQGSTIAKQRQAFSERILGQQRLRDQINILPEVTYDEMMTHYEQNPAEFEVPSRCRWQQITVKFSNHKSKFEAGERIARLGNELALGGTPFPAVAKRESDGSQASEGGYHDWTDWGDLQISRELHDAVFTLPIGQLSYIIKDGEGLHIVRVLEREESHMTPFREAQASIKQKIQADKRVQSLEDYQRKVRERTPIWTIYDPEPTVRQAESGRSNRGPSRR